MSSGKGLGFGIDNIAPVQVAPGQAQHQHLGGGDIAGIGDVVLVAQAGDIDDVRGGLLGVGIVEAEDHVQLVIGDAGADLLATAVVKAHKSVDGQACGLGHHLAGGGGGAKGMLGQDAAIGGAELDHEFLAVVVSDQCDIHDCALLSVQ